MTYWLIVYLFNVNNEFIEKDVTETTSYDHCENAAGAYAKSLINTTNMAQFHCLSDSEYRTEVLKELP